MTQRVTAETRAEKLEAYENLLEYANRLPLVHYSQPVLRAAITAIDNLLADLDDAERRISELEAENARLKGGLLSGIPVYEPDDVMADLLNERQRADSLEAQLADARAESDCASSTAAKIRGALPTGEFDIAALKANLKTDLSDKEIYNALAYLTRRGKIEHVAYGRYCRALKPKESQ